MSRSITSAESWNIYMIWFLSAWVIEITGMIATGRTRHFNKEVTAGLHCISWQYQVIWVVLHALMSSMIQWAIFTSDKVEDESWLIAVNTLLFLIYSISCAAEMYLKIMMHAEYKPARFASIVRVVLGCIRIILVGFTKDVLAIIISIVVFLLFDCLSVFVHVRAHQLVSEHIMYTLANTEEEDDLNIEKVQTNPKKQHGRSGRKRKSTSLPDYNGGRGGPTQTEPQHDENEITDEKLLNGRGGSDDVKIFVNENKDKNNVVVSSQKSLFQFK